MDEPLTELRVAQGIASGVLESPTEYMGSAYFSLRLSGSGAAYRPSIDEFVWRDPDIWLSPTMRQRVAGLPVIVEHPTSGLLTSQSFAASCVGFITFAYADEINKDLRGIARIIDANARDILRDGNYDTSPAIRFDPRSTPAFVDYEGKKLLVEGVPALIDHIALVFTGEGNRGVLTREGEPGVTITEPIVEEELNQ